MSNKQERTLTRFQKANHIKFHNVELLEEAMTHRSYVNETQDDTAVHNERLEFLGDSVVNFVTTDLLFRRFPDLSEGDLTRMRSALVRTESLASLATTIHIGDTLRMGKGEQANGGRERLNNLCDAFEALVGALYMDQGLEKVRAFLVPMIEAQLEQVLSEQLDKDARSRLQEWVQLHHNVTPVYRVVGESGPEHDKEFTVEVLVGEQPIGRGTGRSKQAASQSAARNALQNVDAKAEDVNVEK